MGNPVCATGTCNCGAIAFTINQPLTGVFICHCSICRKSTGSGGIAVTIVEDKNLHITQGDALIQLWKKPAHDWLTRFCQVCGSPLPGKNDDNHAYVPVGLLDSGYEKLKVEHHLFVDSKAPWEELGESGKQHPGQYEA